MKIKNLFKAVLLITIFSGITRVAGFIFRIYLSREIGAESLGLYQIAFSVFIVLITLVCSGLPLTVSRLTAKYDALKKQNEKYKMITSALIIGGISSILLCLVVLLFHNVFNFIFTDSRSILILLSLLPAVVFSSVYSVFRGVMWGENKYLIVCIMELCEQFSRIIICVFALSFLHLALDGSIIASISLTIATLISSLGITIYYFKKGGKLYRPTSEHKELIKTSTPITAVRLVSSLIQPLIAVIIPLGLVNAGYTNSEAVSLYGIAMGMSFPLLFLPTTIVDSLAVTLLPDLSYALATNNTRHINERTRTSIVLSFFIACICTPLFLGLGVPICELLFNNTIAGYFLQNSAIIMIPLALCGISATILNSLGREKKSFLNYLVGAIFLLISISILPKYIGINAIIVGFGLSNFVTTSLNLFELYKIKTVDKTLVKPILLLLLMIIPTALVVYNLYGVIQYILQPLFNIVICCLVSIIIYVLLCEITNTIKVTEIIELFRKKRTVPKV